MNISISSIVVIPTVYNNYINMKLSSQRERKGVGHGAIYMKLRQLSEALKKCISHVRANFAFKIDTSERLFTKSLRVTSYRNTKVYELMFPITATIYSDTEINRFVFFGNRLICIFLEECSTDFRSMGH